MGGLFKIVYSGPIDCEFEVNGRIKGAPSGFSRKSWRTFKRTESLFITFIVFFFALFNALYIVMGIRRLKQKRKLFGFVFIMMGISGLLFVVYIAFYVLNLFSMGPKWIS